MPASSVGPVRATGGSENSLELEFGACGRPGGTLNGPDTAGEAAPGGRLRDVCVGAGFADAGKLVGLDTARNAAAEEEEDLRARSTSATSRPSRPTPTTMPMMAPKGKDDESSSGLSPELARFTLEMLKPNWD